MLVLARERSTDLWGEILPLLKEHYLEISHFPDIELDPDIEAYNQCEALGMLRCYTARLSGELIGYSVNFIRHNMHYQRSLQGVQDVLFVAKAHRHGRVGVKLIRYKEEQLRAEGTQVTYEHTKANDQIRLALTCLNRTDVGAIMERLGYELVDLIYAKRLDLAPKKTWKHPMPEQQWRKLEPGEIPELMPNPIIDEAIEAMKRLDR